MDLIGSFKEGLDRVLHPDKNKDKMGVKDAIMYYYRIMLLPMVIAVIFSVIFGLVLGFAGGLLGGLGGAFLVVYAILLYLIIIPVSILIDAAILQLFSKFIFKIWKGGIDKTVTALVFGELPIILFLWIGFVPLISLILIILAIWSIYVTVVSLSKQHGISVGRAFVGWLIPVIIIGILEVLGLVSFLHL